MQKTITLLIAIALLPQTVAAEVYNCNGIFTNSPCGDSAKELELPVLSRSGAATPPGEKPDLPPGGAAVNQEAAPTKQNTRLRVARDPVWSFKPTGPTVELSEGEVEVRNVGRVEAENVMVSVYLPGGDNRGVSFSGKDTLAPGEVSTYSLKGKGYYIKRGTNLHVTVGCGNCWK